MGTYEVYYFVSRTKTRDKISSMYDPQIIYDSKKDNLESVETLRYIQMHNYGTGVCTVM